MPLPGGPYGITQTGFVAPSMAIIQSAFETDFRAAFGAGIDLNPQSNFGQLIGIMSDATLDMWNLGLADYTAQTAEGSTGVAQDSVNSLTGCIRKVATFSAVELALTGTNATVIDAGKLVAVTGQNPPQFATDAAATLASAATWAPATPYVFGQYIASGTQAWAQSTVYPAQAFATANGSLYYTAGGGTSANSGTGPSGTTPGIPITDNSVTWLFISADLGASIYYCASSGTSGVALSGGPSGQGGQNRNPIPDGSGGLTWLWVGQGAAMAQVAASATATGTLAGPQYNVTVIVTPISGWDGVWNALAATSGAPTETDSAYRQRRDDTLGNEGKGYLNAIQAAVEAVVAVYQGVEYPVTAAKVFENTSDLTGVSGDTAGMPPHSIECLVQGGATLTGGAQTAWRLAVATAIFETIPAGIQPFGQTNTATVTVTDSEGSPQVVQFSQPAAVTITVVLNVTTNPNSPQFNPTDGGQMSIQTAVVNAITASPAGFNIDQSFVSAQAFIANVGAWQVTSCTVNGGSVVAISPRQYPTTGTPNVTVNITQATP